MPENTEVVFVERLWKVLGRQLLFLISFALSLVVYGGGTGMTSSPMAYYDGLKINHSGGHGAPVNDNKRGSLTIQELNDMLQEKRREEFFPKNRLRWVGGTSLTHLDVPVRHRLHFSVDGKGNLLVAGTEKATVFELKYDNKSRKVNLHALRTVTLSPPLDEGSKLCPMSDSEMIEMINPGEIRVRNQNGQVISESISGDSGNTTKAGVTLDSTGCVRSNLNTVGGVVKVQQKNGSESFTCQDAMNYPTGEVICKTIYPNVPSNGGNNIMTIDEGGVMGCSKIDLESGQQIVSQKVECTGGENSFKDCPRSNDTVSCAPSKATYIECEVQSVPHGCSSSSSILVDIWNDEIFLTSLTNPEAEKKKQLNPQAGTNRWHLMNDTSLLVSNGTYVELLRREGLDENFSQTIPAVKLALVDLCGTFGYEYVLGLRRDGSIVKIKFSINEGKIIVEEFGSTGIEDPQRILETNRYIITIGAYEIRLHSENDVALPPTLAAALSTSFTDLKLEQQSTRVSGSYWKKFATISGSVLGVVAIIGSVFIGHSLKGRKNRNADGNDNKRLISRQNNTDDIDDIDDVQNKTAKDQEEMSLENVSTLENYGSENTDSTANYEQLPQNQGRDRSATELNTTEGDKENTSEHVPLMTAESVEIEIEIEIETSI